MVIDVPHMGHIRSKFGNHRSQPPSCVGGVDGVGGVLDLNQLGLTSVLEINMRHEVFIEWGGVAAGVPHGK